MGTQYDRVTVYLRKAKTERAAKRWAREVERATGANVARPVSAFLRYLVDRHEKGRSR